jgi:hypothetical protein
MTSFKRASLAGSDELFRATRPTVVESDVITEVIDRQVVADPTRPVRLSALEVELLLEAIQAAKYPEQRRSKMPLDKFERLDELKGKLQDVYAAD